MSASVLSGCRSLIDKPLPPFVHDPQVEATTHGPASPGTDRVGAVPADARFNAYGGYLKGLFQRTEAEWYHVLEPLPSTAFVGTHVQVRFRINAKGEVTRFVDIQSTAAEPATHACLQAIANAAPFGAWSPEMVNALGTEQDLIIDFIYT